MTTWGELIEKTLRSVLRDESYSTWSPYQVRDAMGWALKTFANHTAPMKEIQFEDGSIGLSGPIDFSTETKIPVPSDLFTPLDTTGQIFYTDSEGLVHHLDPANRTQYIHINVLDPDSFLIWPDNVIILGQAPGAGSLLTIRYFSYWDYPTIDNDDLDISIPEWAEKPVATLTGAYCLEGLGVESSIIDRWKDNSDSGNPEHNALRKQQEYLTGQYEWMIAQHERQDRENFFRERERDTLSPDFYQKWG